MYKKVKFCLSNAKAINVSKELNKFGIQLLITSNSFYSYEKMQEIVNQLKINGIEVNIDFKEKEAIMNKNYEKCGKCKMYKEGLGCISDTARLRTKHLKTANSKGCYWGQWN